jgi:hypothetical protein
LEVGAQSSEGLCAREAGERPRHLVMDFHHPEGALCRVVQPRRQPVGYTNLVGPV